MITPERRLEALQHVNRRRDGFNFLWDWAKIVTISIGLFLVLRTFVVEAFKIPSGSMEHTLLPGDFLLVDKLAFGPDVPFTKLRIPGWRASPSGGTSSCSSGPRTARRTS